MTDKRFSELPEAQALSDTDIFALTQWVGEVLSSRRVTLGQLAAYLSPQATVVKRGESLSATTAAPGTYIFEVGSHISDSPGSGVDSMANAVLVVYETGSKALLSFVGRLNSPEVSRSILCGVQFLLMPQSQFSTAEWKWLGGNGDTMRPSADGDHTIMTIEEASATTRDIPTPELNPALLPVLLAGKLSNALTPDEEVQLTALTQQMLADMREHSMPATPQEDA